MPSESRSENVSWWTITGIGALVAASFGLAVLAWCWAGALGSDRSIGARVALLILGPVPMATASVYLAAMKRSGTPTRSAVGFSAVSLFGTALVVALVRAGAGWF